MPASDAGSLFAALEQIPDPRGRQGQRHSLTAMLAGLICALLCGIRGFKPIAQWLRLQSPEMWHWLGFKWRPPCANCFARLLRQIDPDALEQAVRQWTSWFAEVAGEDDNDDQTLQAVVVDGKTLRGTLQAHRRTVQLLALLDQQTGCVLSQCAVAPGTNEAKAALQLLKTLVLQGKVIVGDAMFCQRDVCQQILDDGGHYFVVVKENQPRLKRDIQLAFADGEGFPPLGRQRTAS